MLVLFTWTHAQKSFTKHNAHREDRHTVSIKYAHRTLIENDSSGQDSGVRLGLSGCRVGGLGCSDMLLLYNNKK
jgi:hypothetical protein